jgi:hypothetical protein
MGGLDVSTQRVRGGPQISDSRLRWIGGVI